MDDALKEPIARAARGDKAALEAVILALKDDLFRLSLRMLGSVPDAQDATQEILVLVVTHVGAFRGESSVRTWSWKIAIRHLVRFRRHRRSVPTSFAEIERLIDAGADAHRPTADDDDVSGLAEEVRLGCTQALLNALKPAQRVVYILSDIFGLESAAGAKVLGIDAATFRKRLERARAALTGFMQRKCGVMNPVAACRCVRQIPVAVEAGLIDRRALLWASLPRKSAALGERAWIELSEIDRAAKTFRDRATEIAPETLFTEIRGMLESGRFSILAPSDGQPSK